RRNAPWPFDVPISDLQATGLSAESIVRMKLFTLDHELVIRIAGKLSDSDREQVVSAVARLLGLA
ncbi:MAG: type II toxin-antitoxin system PemK/MazF family toxin, partial [SAR324 cluster bacterium]|nr:type II toxin-antitoxin system PemK/MazF family toxin [SAR324 cluster bacterium]